MEAGVGELGGRVDRLLHRHLLEQRDEMHGGERSVQQLDDADALPIDRSDLGELGDLGGRIEELPDPSGGRRVEHHRVVDVPPGLVTPDHRFLDLAGQQHVAQARRERGDEVDGTDPT